MSQTQIVLFSGVKIQANQSKQHTIEYLKRYCIIDDLGDTIYVKKLGDDKTTFAIDYTSNEISAVRKIKDEKGNNLDKIIFENYDEWVFDGFELDDIDYDDCCNDNNYEDEKW